MAYLTDFQGQAGSIGVYKPVTAVWEITMACNMRCRHCGSSCASALEDELTTGEALALCADLGRMGFEWITISGGEPTVRKDWHLIAAELKKYGVIPNLITNGWSFDSEMARKASEAGINTVAVSIDGLEPTHDYIRKKGSYARTISALDTIRTEKSLNSAVITTINKMNLKELHALKDILANKEVVTWQLQIALPMGNMKQIDELVIGPGQVEEIVDFAYRAQNECDISIQLADCIGYHAPAEMAVRCRSSGAGMYWWQGCNAGKYCIGILHNGDITGCTSVRDPSFIEGNIRIKPVSEIWNDPDSFSWNRRLTRDKLAGTCRKCRFADSCTGGCSNTKLTMGGSVFSENIYCLYRLSVLKEAEKYQKASDPESIYIAAKNLALKGDLQTASLLLAGLDEKELNENRLEILNLYGYVDFMLGNYADALETNRKAIALAPCDAYTNKGYGLCLYKTGKVKEGIKYLKKAVKYADDSFLDPYHDLAFVLWETGHLRKARSVLDRVRKKSDNFKALSQPLYDKVAR